MRGEWRAEGLGNPQRDWSTELRVVGSTMSGIFAEWFPGESLVAVVQGRVVSRCVTLKPWARQETAQKEICRSCGGAVQPGPGETW
jgi:hypothetical protein